MRFLAGLTFENFTKKCEWEERQAKANCFAFVAPLDWAFMRIAHSQRQLRLFGVWRTFFAKAIVTFSN